MGETEAERKLRKEAKRRKRDKERESGDNKRKSTSKRADETEEERRARKKAEKRERRKQETSAERRERKSKSSAQEQSSSAGFMAPTKSKAAKESESTFTYERKVTIDKNNNNGEEEIDEVYDEDFDEYDDDFETFEPNKPAPKTSSSTATSKKATKKSKASKSPDNFGLEFDYAALQAAMKREASEASLKQHHRRSVTVTTEQQSPSSPSPSQSPATPPPHKPVAAAASKERTIPPKRCNRARAREIARLITLDQSGEITFKLVGEGHQMAQLRSGLVKCVASGTDDVYETQTTQTEEVETSEEWTQNQTSSRTISHIKTDDHYNYQCIPRGRLVELTTLTLNLLDEQSHAAAKVNVSLRDVFGPDECHVELDRQWTRGAFYNDSQLTVIK